LIYIYKGRNYIKLTQTWAEYSEGKKYCIRICLENCNDIWFDVESIENCNTYIILCFCIDIIHNEGIGEVFIYDQSDKENHLKSYKVNLKK
jgi:hypothetical protein